MASVPRLWAFSPVTNVTNDEKALPQSRSISPFKQLDSIPSCLLQDTVLAAVPHLFCGLHFFPPAVSFPSKNKCACCNTCLYRKQIILWTHYSLPATAPFLSNTLQRKSSQDFPLSNLRYSFDLTPSTETYIPTSPVKRLLSKSPTMPSILQNAIVNSSHYLSWPIINIVPSLSLSSWNNFCAWLLEHHSLLVFFPTSLGVSIHLLSFFLVKFPTSKYWSAQRSVHSHFFVLTFWMIPFIPWLHVPAKFWQLPNIYPSWNFSLLNCHLPREAFYDHLISNSLFPTLPSSPLSTPLPQGLSLSSS